jgi:hypothetical protein
MKIALHDSDKTNFPNLALMKLSAWHRAQGDDVDWYNPMFESSFDKVYSSKVFTFTKEYPYLWFENSIKGGSGYDLSVSLPDEIEHTCPDYQLYGIDYSVGFLTRGCSNKCPWCIVPQKEGAIREHADIDEFLRHDEAVLLDNNVLAHEHGIRQIEKIARLKIKVDFCQGLDARLIDKSVAKLLSSVKWRECIRLACDSQAMIEPVRKAVELLRWHNARPTRYMVYVLVRDVEEALDRIRFLKSMDLDPHAQPYRDLNGTEPTREQKDLARWCNHKATYKTCTWEDYVARVA